MILQVDDQILQSDRCSEQRRFTDFTLICEGMKFEVHKVILFSQTLLALEVSWLVMYLKCYLNQITNNLTGIYIRYLR